MSAGVVFAESGGGAVVQSRRWGLSASFEISYDAQGMPVLDVSTSPGSDHDIDDHNDTNMSGLAEGQAMMRNGSSQWVNRDLTAADIQSGTLATARGGTNLGTYVQGDILYASAANVLSALAGPVVDGWVLTWDDVGNLPEWRAPDVGVVYAEDVGGTNDSERTFEVDGKYTFQNALDVGGNVEVAPTIASAFFIADRPSSSVASAFSMRTSATQNFWVALVGSDTTNGYIGTGVTASAAAASMGFVIASQNVEFYGAADFQAGLTATTGTFTGNISVEPVGTSAYSIVNRPNSTNVAVFALETAGTQQFWVSLAGSDTTNGYIGTRVIPSASEASMGFVLASKNVEFYGQVDTLSITDTGSAVTIGNATTINSTLEVNNLLTATSIKLDGASRSVVADATDGVVYLVGSAAVGSGGEITLFGSTFSGGFGGPNDIRFRAAGTEVLRWDHSDDQWESTKPFTIAALTATTGEFSGNITFGLNGGILRDVDDGFLAVSGGTATNVGSNITLYGSTHATLADDIRIRASGTTVLYWDESDDQWESTKAWNIGALTATTGDFAGDVLPTVAGTYDLGSTTYPWGGLTVGAASNYTYITDAGVLAFVGTAGLSCGNMWIHEASVTITISANDTYYQITGFTAGNLNGCTVVSDSLRVPIVGFYFVTWNVSGDSTGVNDEYEFDIFVNDVEQDTASATNQFGAIAAKSNTGASGIIDVTNTSHDIDLKIKQTSAGSDDFVVNSANVTVFHLSGT